MNEERASTRATNAEEVDGTRGFERCVPLEIESRGSTPRPLEPALVGLPCNFCVRTFVTHGVVQIKLFFFYFLQIETCNVTIVSCGFDGTRTSYTRR